jgi:membrane protein
VGGILWEVGKQLLAWYIGRLAWQATYGTLAGAVILLVWVFYSAQVLLLSAKLAETLDDAREGTEEGEEEQEEQEEQEGEGKAEKEEREERAGVRGEA